MKSYFVILFKALIGGNEYTTLSNYYFKTREDASAYALHFIKKSTCFSSFEIMGLTPAFYE